MAVIDFPTSPVNGQIFNAPNGVTYRWQSTPAPGLWLSGSGAASVSSGVTPPASPAANALWWNTDSVTGGGQLYVYYNDGSTTQWVPASPGMSTPTTPGGDFMATNGSDLGNAPTATVLVLNTVQTGNSGGWYSTSTGRYTPPAGRYYISCTLGQAGSGIGATQIVVYLRKNGVTVATSSQTPATTNWYGDPEVHGVFDANGTDYFEVFRQDNEAGTGIFANTAKFLAFPLSGVKGPPGDLASPTGIIVDFAGSIAPGGWLLCQGQSVTVAAYGALHAVIGYTYGGSGLNFNVPDLGGRVVAGKEITATRLTTAGGGVDGATVGATGGVQSAVLTTEQMAAGIVTSQASGAGYTLSFSGPSGVFFIQGGVPVRAVQPTIIMNKIIKV